jgi:hypothetical protein
MPIIMRAQLITAISNSVIFRFIPSCAVATLRLSYRGLIPSGGGDIFHRATMSAPVVIHASSYPVCIWGPYAGIKFPGREADHSPPLIVDIRFVNLYLHSTTLHCGLVIITGTLHLQVQIQWLLL